MSVTKRCSLITVSTDLEVIRNCETRRMRKSRDMNIVLERKIERRRRAEAVACGTDPGDTLSLQGGQNSFDERDGTSWRVLAEPSHEIEAGGAKSLSGDRIFVEVIRDNNLISSSCEGIGEELKVGRLLYRLHRIWRG